MHWCATERAQAVANKTRYETCTVHIGNPATLTVRNEHYTACYTSFTNFCFHSFPLVAQDVEATSSPLHQRLHQLGVASPLIDSPIGAQHRTPAAAALLASECAPIAVDDGFDADDELDDSNALNSSHSLADGSDATDAAAASVRVIDNGRASKGGNGVGSADEDDAGIEAMGSERAVVFAVDRGVDEDDEASSTASESNGVSPLAVAARVELMS